MTVYLLDVNFLLALTDPMHVHHDTAHVWFSERGRTAWATCPITENGFVRVASNPRYPNRPGDVTAVIKILTDLCALEGHEFWAEDVTVRELLLPDAVVTHRQLTDVYLVGLAAAKGGKLATLDQRIQGDVVRGGREVLEVID